jgi:hypothetical protein
MSARLSEASLRHHPDEPQPISFVETLAYTLLTGLVLWALIFIAFGVL